MEEKKKLEKGIEENLEEGFIKEVIYFDKEYIERMFTITPEGEEKVIKGIQSKPEALAFLFMLQWNILIESVKATDKDINKILLVVSACKDFKEKTKRIELYDVVDFDKFCKEVDFDILKHEKKILKEYDWKGLLGIK